MSSSLIHDAATAAARLLLERYGRRLRKRGRRRAYAEFYQVVRACIEAYELQARRLHRRLDPTEN